LADVPIFIGDASLFPGVADGGSFFTAIVTTPRRLSVVMPDKHAEKMPKALKPEASLSGDANQ
jgi:hypothetical protein